MKELALKQYQEDPRRSYAFQIILDHDVADGNLVEARSRVEQVFPEFLDPSVELRPEGFLFMLKPIHAARVLMRTGDERLARQLLEKVLARLNLMPQDYDHEASKALSYAVLGDEVIAMAAIRQFFDLGGSPYFSEMYPGVRSVLQPYFEHPEYQTMAEKRKAELAVQLKRLQDMEARGELAPIPPELLEN